MKTTMRTVRALGLAALAAAAAGCSGNPSAPDLKAPASSPARPVNHGRMSASDYEIVLDGGGCTKTWQEDRFIMINGGPDRCICNVTTSCPGATYYWSSSAYTCYAGSCQG